MPTNTTRKRTSETLPLGTTAAEPAPSQAPALNVSGSEDAQPPAELVLAPAPPPITEKFIEKAGKAHVPFVNGVARPDSVEGLFRIAEIFWQGGMLPGGVDNMPKMMIVLMAGQELGLSPAQAVQNIMVVNNRPSVWGDAMLAICQASGLMEDFEESIAGEGDAMTATCRVQRRGRKTPVIRTFSVADAKTAGLWGKRTGNGRPTPWVTNPTRMLQMRARAFALRDALPDVLKGIGMEEEVGDYIMVRTPKPSMNGASASEDLGDLPQQEAVDLTKVRRA